MKSIKKIIESIFSKNKDNIAINSNQIDIFLEISANNNKWNKEIVELLHHDTINEEACTDNQNLEISEFTNNWNKLALTSTELFNSLGHRDRDGHY